MINLQEHYLNMKYAISKDICKLDALIAIQKFKARASLQQDELFESMSTLDLAKTFSDMGELSISNDMLIPLTAYFSNLKLHDYLHETYLLLGHNHACLGKTEESIRAYYNASKLIDVSQYQQAKSLLNVSKYAIKFSQFDKALQHLNTAMKLIDLKSKFQRKLYFEMLFQVVKVCLSKKDYKLSIHILQKIKRAQNIQQLDGVSSMLEMHYALYYEAKGCLTKAAYHYKQAIHLNIINENLMINLSYKTKLSQIYIRQGNLNKAAQVLLEAYHTYPYEENKFFLVIISSLVEVFQLKGDKKEQLRFEQELCLRTS